MKRFLILAAAMILGAVGLSAQNTWEGTAAMGRYGEFPPTGLYAASNSFPRNSIVDVTNVRTGKTTRVIIAKNLSDPGLFIVLSEEAARELELGRADVASVRINPVFTPGVESASNARDLPYSQDPEVNPQARLADSNTVINAREVPGRVPAAPRPDAVPLPLRPESAPVDASGVPDPKSLPAVAPDTTPEAPLNQAPPAAVTIAPPAPAAELPPAAEKPAAAEALAAPEEPLAAPGHASAEAPVVPVAPPIPAAAPAAAPEPAAGIAQAPPESDWARPAPTNALDQSLDNAAGRSPQKNLFPPPLEENVAAIETPKPASPAAEPAGRPLPEAAPEGESRPVNDSVQAVQPPAASLEAHLAEARPAEEPFEARPDLVYPEAAAETALYFNDVERVAEVPGGTLADTPSPGMERPAGVETVLALEPAELRPPVQPRPEDYLPAVDEPERTALALALDEPEAASARPDSVGPGKTADTGTLQKLETIIASIPPKQEPGRPEKPIESGPPVKPIETAPALKPAASADGLPIVAALEKNSYYLQLGVYSNMQSARSVLLNLGPSYPVAVLAAGGEKTLYRVYVGPVREDEKGGLLHLLRARGFKDVFVRKGS